MDEKQKDYGKVTPKTSLGEYLFGELGEKVFDENVDHNLSDYKLGALLKARLRIVENKYGLPDVDLYFSKRKEYISQVKKRMEEIDVQIKDCRENPDWIADKHTPSCAYQHSKRTIWIDNRDLGSGDLGHEATHAVQYALFPEMSIEEKEYDACLINNINPNLLDRAWVQAVLLHSITNSVNYFRSQKK